MEKSKKTKNQKRRLRLKAQKERAGLAVLAIPEVHDKSSNREKLDVKNQVKAGEGKTSKKSSIAQLIRTQQAKQRADEEKKVLLEAQKIEEQKRQDEQHLLEAKHREQQRLDRIAKRKKLKEELRTQGLLPPTRTQKVHQKTNQTKLAQMPNAQQSLKHNSDVKTDAPESREEDLEENKHSQKIMLRAPILCVLAHADVGKTTLLDCIRGTHVQSKEAKGITQQVGSTFIPRECLPANVELQGLLVMDTPGHESFFHMRARGTSLCDMGILLIDIMHGLERQTLECLNMLKKKKTPFVVALNKVDRLYEWKPYPDHTFQSCLKNQSPMTQDHFDRQWARIKVELAKQCINSELYYENKDIKSVVSVVPTSGVTRDGVSDLLAWISRLAEKRMRHLLEFREDVVECSVFEVKSLEGYGYTIDVILKNGTLKVGDPLVLCGLQGPIVTNIRCILLPPPMHDQRVKTCYSPQTEVRGTASVKLVADNLDHVVPGTTLYRSEANPELLQTVQGNLETTLSHVDRSGKGVYLQSSSLGSLEALLSLLQDQKVPIHGMNIGPVAKRDVMRAATMVQVDPQYAALLAFDVKVSSEAQDVAKEMKVEIFSSPVVFELVELFVKHLTLFREKEKEIKGSQAVFPVILKILPEHVFRKSNPIILGVSVEEGTLFNGTLLCVISGGQKQILGRVESMEHNNQAVVEAKAGDQICVKIQPIANQPNVIYGRQFSASDLLYSSLTRESIDALKAYFKEQVSDEEWQLVIRLKKILSIP